MRPIQCFFYPKGAAHLIAQLELRISELEQANLYLQTKPEAQLRRLQSEREGRKAARPAHVYDQLILQESIENFIKANCHFSAHYSISMIEFYHGYCSSLGEAEYPTYLQFSYAIRDLAQARKFAIEGRFMVENLPLGQIIYGFKPSALSRHFNYYLPPSSKEEPKLSDAIFGQAATSSPLTNRDLGDEHDQAEEEWLSRLPKQKVNPDDWKLEGSWNVTPPQEEPRATGSASAPAWDDDDEDDIPGPGEVIFHVKAGQDLSHLLRPSSSVIPSQAISDDFGQAPTPQGESSK